MATGSASSIMTLWRHGLLTPFPSSPQEPAALIHLMLDVPLEHGLVDLDRDDGVPVSEADLHALADDLDTTP
jgi:hypothetical protein